MGRKPLDQGAAFRRIEVRLDAALAAIAPVKIGGAESAAIPGLDKRRTPLPRVVACSGGLNLHNIGAQIGEQLPAPGPGQDAGKLKHADILEWRRLHD